MSESSPQLAVQVRNISKSFGNIRVLNDVSMEVRAGEIYALVGANGAGKSTLIKIICGYYSDYQGEFFIGTQACRFASPNEAYTRGIVAVHQLINQGVIPTLTVAENLVLGEMLSGSNGEFRYRREKVRERARVIAARMELQHLDLDAPVSSLVQSERQLIAIARALATDPRLLILDEPTSSLSQRETEKLFEHLQRLRAQGVAILYVSHRLHEIERLADRVGVMRDGSFSTCLVRPFHVSSIVHAMVGDSGKVQARTPRAAQTPQGQPRLELRDLVVQQGGPAINLRAYANDIIGITGLIGAGKSELAAVLFGLAEPVSGQILVDGVVVHSKTPAQAIANGIFLVPEDRASKAVVPEFSIRSNMTLPFMKFFSGPLGLIRHAQEQTAARHMVEQLGIKCESDATPISSLSGGNQQKVIVSRWLMQPSRVLLLDEPYQGVDIRTRQDINTYLRTQCQDRAVIVFAADLDEVLEVADRVLVINHGSLVGEQHHTDIRRAELVGWTAQSAA
jgi:simple sugar transport system ATP-binding protein